LEVAEDVRLHAPGRLEKARIFTKELSFDVWDALRLRSQLPPPSTFTGGVIVDAVDDALPKRFWAHALLGTIARHQAVSLCAELTQPEDWAQTASPLSCENMVASMSSFYNVSMREVSLQLDSLIDQCEALLKSRNAFHTVDCPCFDLKTACNNIQQALFIFGFKLVANPRTAPGLSHFPHHFLQPGNRETHPLPLAYLFVAMARRMKLQCQIVFTEGPERGIRVRVAERDLTKPQFPIDPANRGAEYKTISGPWTSLKIHSFTLLMHLSRVITLHMQSEYSQASHTSLSCDSTMPTYNFATTGLALVQQDIGTQDLGGCPCWQ